MPTKDESMKMHYVRLGVTIALFLFFAANCARLKDKIEKTPPSPTERKTFFIIAGSLNLRDCPGLTCQAKAVLKHGEEVIKIGEEGEWLKVQVKTSGIEGWVSSKFVGPTHPKPIMAAPPGKETSKPQEEWAPSDKEKKALAPPPKEGFAK